MRFDYGKASAGNDSIAYRDRRYIPYEKGTLSEKGGKFRSLNTKAMLNNLKKSMNIYGEAGSPMNVKETAEILS